MGTVPYDKSNPWHREVNLLYGLHCSRCAAALDYTKVDRGDLGAPFLESCVGVAEGAQGGGWVMTGDGDRFVSPACPNGPAAGGVGDTPPMQRTGAAGI